MPSLIQPLLRIMTPARHPPHLTPALFKSHSHQLPSSRCIESAHALQCNPRFLAAGASDTALGLRENFQKNRTRRSVAAQDYLRHGDFTTATNGAPQPTPVSLSDADSLPFPITSFGYEASHCIVRPFFSVCVWCTYGTGSMNSTIGFPCTSHAESQGTGTRFTRRLFIGDSAGMNSKSCSGRQVLRIQRGSFRPRAASISPFSPHKQT